MIGKTIKHVYITVWLKTFFCEESIIYYNAFSQPFVIVDKFRFVSFIDEFGIVCNYYVHYLALMNM